MTVSSTPPLFMKLLSHDLRWQIVQSLTVSDYRVNELVALVEHPLNLVSYHLKQLRDEALVTTRRSEADGRDTYYSLDLERLRELFSAAGRAIHPTFVGPSEPLNLQIRPKILFVCTHNSARSQMAEGLMRYLSQGQIDVSSAGSDPTSIHPDAIDTMQTLGIDIRQQQSKSFVEVMDKAYDAVITVCDRAREVCPTFPGEGQQIHWGYPDPSIIDDDTARQKAFAQTATGLKSRIVHYIARLAAGSTS